MPVVTFEAALLTTDQKQALAKEFTDTVSRITGSSKDKIYVFIKENAFDNIGVGGTLLSTKKSV